MRKNIWDNNNLVKTLQENGVVVMPTDTIYGIVGKAENENVVNRIYKIRERNPKKPCIILIGDINELEKFSILLTEEQKSLLKKYWFTLSEVEGSFDPTQDPQSNPVSVILDCPDDLFAYLHRGTKTLAFRIPVLQGLRDLLLKVGPLIAPSANKEGFPPGVNIQEAKKYFGDLVDPVRGRESSQRPSTSNGVDLYIDGGEIKGQASRVVRLHKDSSFVVIRR